MVLLDPRTGALGGGGPRGRLALLAALSLALGGAGAFAARAMWVGACEADDLEAEYELQEVDLTDVDDEALLDEDDRDECDVDASDDPVADQLEAVDQAMELYLLGEYASARSVALEAAAEPLVRARALRVAAASSCFLKDRAGVAAAWDDLDAIDRGFVEYVCTRNGVRIP